MKKKTTNQRFAYILLDNIEPSSYQRNTNPTQVANIVNQFDGAKLGVITVSLRDGKYRAIDGQHRLAALRSLNYSHALWENAS